eukprot:TRINITY_DN2206_c0_g1_i5.p1 TRINITY_DN2206_c0_g1~~TRINITY_DN2206_c0_g1_i5.p1  ORF type:complete len:645 (+),score=159.67 TRINITY_DN2206_c0_g1_i5:218-2152(+)
MSIMQDESPSKGKKGAGKKKKKISAAKLAEMERKAEEERRRLEEEEQKRREQERIEAEERERQRKEEAERRRAAEADRRNAETLEARDWDQDHQVSIYELEHKTRVDVEWKRFLECNVRPDPLIERDLNTFVSTWKEEEEKDLERVLRQVQFVEQIIEDIQKALAEVEERRNMSTARRLKDAILELRSIALQKIDFATADILQFADEHASAKNEVQKSIALEDIKYSLWVNLAKNPRIKSIDYPDLNITFELPKSLALASIAIRMMQYPEDNISKHHFSSLIAVGCIFTFEILALPPPPKKIKGWVLRPVTNLATSVSRLPYPLSSAGESAPLAGSSQWPPIKITCVLPPHILSPPPDDDGTERNFQVGWWDRDGLCWKTEGVTDVSFEPGSRQISFHTLHLADFAVVNDRFMEVPYRGWKLQTYAANRTRFSLLTRTRRIEIEIEDGLCRLVMPESPETAHLNKQMMRPSLLLKRLASCGINIMPTDDWYPCVENSAPKDEVLEHAVYRDLNLACPAITITSSKWNKRIGREKFTMRIQPSEYIESGELPMHDLRFDLEDEEVSRSWQTVFFEQENCAFIRVVDTDQEFAEEMIPSAVGHSNLIACLKEVYPPHLVTRCRHAHARHTDALVNLLRWTRVFNFT